MRTLNPTLMSLQDLMNPSPMQPANIQHDVRFQSPSHTPPLFSPPPSPCDTITSSHSPSATYDVRINHKTTLHTLYRYPLGSIIEYPKTSTEGSVGHLFEIVPENWSNPRLNFAYVQGPPTGRTKIGSYVQCPLLVDEDGEEVPCREIHSTCMFHNAMQ